MMGAVHAPYMVSIGPVLRTRISIASASKESSRSATEFRGRFGRLCLRPREEALHYQTQATIRVCQAFYKSRLSKEVGIYPGSYH